MQNQPGSDLVLADCVRFWPENLIEKQAGVQKSLGLLLASGSKLIQTGCKLDLACLLGKCHYENLFNNLDKMQFSTVMILSRFPALI